MIIFNCLNGKLNASFYFEVILIIHILIGYEQVPTDKSLK
jgi:hypothetical protein